MELGAIVPKDHWNVAYAIFLLQGIGQLFPWNAFINAESYFRQRFCGTAHADNFENYFSVAYNAASCIGLLLAVKWQHKFSQRARVIPPLGISVAVFFTSTMLCLNTTMAGDSLFLLTMFLIVVSALSVAILQGGLFGLSGLFPGRFTQAQMAGQGLAGLVVALAGVFTALAGPDTTICTTGKRSQVEALFGQGHGQGRSLGACTPYEVDGRTVTYFALATGVLALCILGYFALERLPVTLYYTTQHEGDDGSGMLTPLVNGDSRKDAFPEEDGAVAAVVPLSVTFKGDHHTINGSPPIKPLAGQSRYPSITPFGASVCVVFVVTLALFPSLSTRIHSTRYCEPGSSRWNGEMFVLFSFVSYNATDFLGRVVAGLYRPIPPRRLWVASCARAVFFPLFLLCNVKGSRLPQPLRADGWPLSIMPLFGFSNGYLSSCSMMAGPEAVPTHQKELAGTLMCLWLNLGLLAGSLLSFATVYVSTGAV